jgi:hypothetical protein
MVIPGNEVIQGRDEWQAIDRGWRNKDQQPAPF